MQRPRVKRVGKDTHSRGGPQALRDFAAPRNVGAGIHWRGAEVQMEELPFISLDNPVPQFGCTLSKRIKFQHETIAEHDLNQAEVGSAH